MLAIIVALGKNNEIGKDNKMPWHIKEDLQYFKEQTINKTIIMGRKTFESLPYVLPRRKHIVISRNPNYSNDEGNVFVENDIDNVINTYKNSEELAFIIGGGEIYKKAIDHCKYLYLTKIDANFDADVYFPAINYDEFSLLQKSDVYVDEDAGVSFCFEVYERI